MRPSAAAAVAALSLISWDAPGDGGPFSFVVASAAAERSTIAATTTVSSNARHPKRQMASTSSALHLPLEPDDEERLHGVVEQVYRGPGWNTTLNADPDFGNNDDPYLLPGDPDLEDPEAHGSSYDPAEFDEDVGAGQENKDLIKDNHVQEEEGEEESSARNGDSSFDPDEGLLYDPLDTYAYDQEEGEEGIQRRRQAAVTMREIKLKQRALQTGHIGDFAPLDCNADLATKDCSTNLVSSLTYSSTTELVIPCGACYTYDLGEGATTTLGGLNIKGKLVFPPEYQTTVKTPYVFVQGELEITDSRTVTTSDQSSVKFLLTGTSDVLFTPTDAPNANACSGSCNVGSKPFLIAGGRLNVNAYPDACPTWTKLKGIAKGDREYPTADDLLQSSSVQVNQPAACNDRAIVSNDFSSTAGGFTGNRGGIVTVENGVMKVSNRNKKWQGPYYDYTSRASCLLPNTKYLITARIKLDKAGHEGLPTKCHAGDGNSWEECVRITNQIGIKTGGDRWKHFAFARKNNGGTYGEWFTITGVFEFTPEETDVDTNYYWTTFIENAEEGVDVSLDEFYFGLPDETSYARYGSGDVCYDLVPGTTPDSAAYANGWNPYPMEDNNGGNLIVLQEVEEDAATTNTFYRLVNRGAHWHSMTFPLETSCLKRGLVYHATVTMRIHSGSTPVRSYVEFWGYKSAEKGGAAFAQTLFECPAQSGLDGWVTCEGDFTITDDMSDASYLKFQMPMYYHDGEAAQYSEVDYDDIAITFRSGLEGTSNAHVASNIAHDTAGHCFYLGFETEGNTFAYNLGSVTNNRVGWNRNIPGENDHDGATFTAYYASSDFIGNAAAGGEHNGFYLYNYWYTKGEDGHDAGIVNARSVSPGIFRDNIAHSNNWSGVAGYHFEAVFNGGHGHTFENLKAYKNQNHGLFVYDGTGVVVQGGIFSDNRYGIELRWSDDSIIDGADIRGLSAQTRVVTSLRSTKLCPSSHPIEGIRLHTVVNRNWFKMQGAQLRNLLFKDFDNNEDCSSSIPIAFGPEKRSGHWDYLTSFESIVIEDSRGMMLDACAAAENGVADIVITDVDSSCDPSSPAATGPSAMVSTADSMMALSGGECTDLPGCISYCRQTCLRTVTYHTEASGTEGWSLVVTRDEDGTEISVSSKFWSRNEYEDSGEWARRTFSASLPAGSYTAKFVDNNGIDGWPTFVNEVWEDAPACTGHASGGDVKLVEPEPASCDDLAQNGNVIDSYQPWRHTGGGVQFLPNGGIGGSGAIKTVDRHNVYHALGQNVDTRCLHLSRGKFYEIKAMLSLEDANGQKMACDPNKNEWSGGCPSVTFKMSGYNDASRESMWTNWHGNKAVAARPYIQDEFNLVHGIFKVDEYSQSAERLFWYIEKVNQNYDIILDDISITPVEESCDEFIKNGDMEHGTSMYWDTWGEVSLEIVEGFQGGNALRAFNRQHAGWGQSQVFGFDCLKAGDRIAITAKVKVEKNGAIASCDPFTWDGGSRCSDIFMHTNKKGASDSWGRIAETVQVADENGWYAVSGILTLDENKEDADLAIIWFDGAHPSYDVTVDNVIFKPLPNVCSDLVQNPSFEDGTASFWFSDNRPESAVGVYQPGAGGTSDYALRLYDRKNSWNGARQKLDPRCFVEGEEFMITAKFRLLDGTSGENVHCETAIQWNNGEQCPSVIIFGLNCDGGNVWQHYWNEKDYASWSADEYNDYEADFTVNKQLSTCSTVYAYLRDVNQAWDIIVDDFQISTKTTLAPTSKPTMTPTKQTTLAPTGQSAPTTKPTPAPTAVAISCPEPGGEPMEIPAGPTMLVRAGGARLCTLTKIRAVNATGSEPAQVVPVARSYDEHDWSFGAGDFVAKFLYDQSFMCYAGGCQLDLPDVSPDEGYYLTSYTHSLSDRNRVARFMEQTTFGVTSAELDAWDYGIDMNANMEAWITDQMDENSAGITSHREYFRMRANPRFPTPRRVASPDHPCSAHSRWRKFTFSRKDSVWWMDNILRISSTNGVSYTLTLDGHIRTVVSDIHIENSAYSSWVPDANFEYRMCWSPEERSGGLFWIHVEDGSCQAIQNPAVDLSSHESLATYIVDLDPSRLMMIDETLSNNGEVILLDEMVGSACDSIPDVIEEGDAPVFGRLPDGSWLQYDPRLVLEENTPDAPIPDGGGSTELATGGETRCANVPRTFLNEESCVLSTSVSACGSLATPEIFIELNEDNLLTIKEKSRRYLYSILGLPLDASLGHVCTPGRSRWEILPASSCSPTSLSPLTNATLTELILNNDDTNTLIRDTEMPESGMECDAADENVLDADIIVRNRCFRRVHPEHMSVFDFTYWTRNDTHPGNMYAAMEGHPHPIKKWADIDGTALLTYPSTHPIDPSFNHPISRWDSNHQKFQYVGRFGDDVRFRDLPNELRLDDIAQHFGATESNGGSGILVCGSPSEVDNDETLGSFFDIATGRDTNWGLGRQREYVWTMAVLGAKDQLRQRVAWALSQILVVVRTAIENEHSNSEVFLNYYDIFVNHAFGNYRDILKEISYSPLMAENLSYMQSRSSAYMWEHFQRIAFADENFAREIMQLFSTGLVQLNLDGTPKLDDDGNEILVYTNEAIMSFARAWTGFDRQVLRGNTEDVSWSGNRLDPMRIEAVWRDRFPKSDLLGGYIGDGYPLCVDLPSKMFLSKGAQYRLLGSSSLPELTEDPSQFASDPTIKRFVLDQDSNLRSLLCDNETESGECKFLNTVSLESNVACAGSECEVDTVRVVQVTPDIFYEFVRPPCVEQAFYENARKIGGREQSSRATCANPKLPLASEACCAVGSREAVRNNIYDGERMTYAAAEDRCDQVSRETCDYNIVLGDYHKIAYGAHWTTDPCLIRVKVNAAGYAAIVYEPSSYTSKVRHVNDDTRNFFKVYWNEDSYPSSSNNCGSGACSLQSDGSCLCDASVETSAVFSSMPDSVGEALSSLYIGAYDPVAYDTVVYNVEADSTTGITAYTIGGAFDANTIFAFTDEMGREHLLKNAIETVHVPGASFRNAPMFMSLIHSETSVRDAQYETEATLDHYFYHDNTAPFIAIRLIQRLVSSNPSPRYVEAVATAFRTGTFATFGTGDYGDLSATIAAILLDPEARSIELDKDPSYGSLREPLLKVISLMRSMEFAPNSNEPVIRFHDMDRAIGQMAHNLPTVFSFFLPEYKPHGRVEEAGLSGPEGLILDMPKIVGLLNGCFSLVKYGLSPCHNGFASGWGGNCQEANYDRATGVLQFSGVGGRRQLQNSDAIVDELATLLTAGRLSEDNRNIIKVKYNAAADADAGLRLAQQLILTSPEYHSTNTVKKSGATREPYSPPQSTGKPYKAIVYLLFSGGCDSYNMLVPLSCSEKDMYQEYSQVRGQVALAQNSLEEISAQGQICETFGVHGNLPDVAQLYKDGDLLFFANTGVLTTPVTKDNFWQLTATQLFAHNHMQREAMRVDPLDREAGTGVIGRISDVLSRDGYSVQAFSVDRNSVALLGTPAESPATQIIGRNGVSEFNIGASTPDMMDTITALNEATTADSGFFAETWSEKLLHSLAHNELLHSTLADATTANEFPSTHLGDQLEIVAKMIGTRQERGVDTDMFFVEIGGFDTHSDVETNLQNRFIEVNDAVAVFASELKQMNVWDSVTTIQTSDFARTLAPNSGDGTDHAWGGNYMMFGGGVKGGQIVGQYPDDLTDDGPLSVGRGRLIPTTPWEAGFQAIAEWAGVSAEDLDEICPNRHEFPEALFTKDDLFETSTRKRYLRK